MAKRNLAAQKKAPKYRRYRKQEPPAYHDYHDYHEVLERALDEVADRIERAAVARVAQTGLQVGVTQEAKDRLKRRYRPMFEEALENGKNWELDREQVLLRADQVGYVAGLALLMITSFLEFERAGVGTRPGQDIELEPLHLPEVNGALAIAAAKVIDCVKSATKPSDGVTIQWDWCTRDGPVSFLGFLNDVVHSQTVSASAETLETTLSRAAKARMKRKS